MKHFSSSRSASSRAAQMLSRRAILWLAPGVLATPAWLKAQTMGKGAHDMGAMSGMGSMPGMGPMSGMSGMNHAAAQPKVGPLAADDALPSGQVLRAMTPLVNQSRKAGTFRARLVAAPTQVELIPGQKTEIWAYNGITPGPLIEVSEGDTVEIEFVNRLPQPSTIHWHGLPVPADQDGAPMDPVEPGGRKLYRYTLPKDCAGTYWYHPHPHFMTAEQVYRGLAGAIVVRAKDDPLRHLPERHWFFSDLRLTAEGSIPPNTADDWINGREGQFALANGQLRPVAEVKGRERWRIWNANSARYLRLNLGGRKFDWVGTDGGLLEAPVSGLSEMLLAPAERVEIIVSPESEAQSWELSAESYDRGLMNMRAMMEGKDARRLPPAPRRVMAQVKTLPASAADRVALPKQLRAIEPLGEAKVTRQVMLTEVMDMNVMMSDRPKAGGRPQGMQFQINGKLFDMKRVDFTSKRGEVELWEIINASDMDHPFHIHGTRFQVIERVRDNVTTPEAVLAWRDTVNVRPAEIVRIKLAQAMPGLRMFHCHVLEHEDMGMMANLMVE